MSNGHVDIYGILINGLYHNERFGLFATSEDIVRINWACIINGYFRGGDGIGCEADPELIVELNAMIAEKRTADSFAPATVQELRRWSWSVTENERFDRVKLEAHQARLDHNNAYESYWDTPKACDAERRTTQKRAQLDIAMSMPLPLDGPRLGGKRAGLEG